MAKQKPVVEPQFNYRHLRAVRWHDNAYKCKGNQLPCLICGKPCNNPKYFVWEHLGGGVIVTQAEGERLNATGQGGADLGMQPIGPDCLKRHPELRPYLESEYPS